MNDAYPFVLTQSVRTKLSFVHHAIHNKLDKMKNQNRKRFKLMEKKEHNQVNDVINLEKSDLYMAEIYNIIDQTAFWKLLS